MDKRSHYIGVTLVFSLVACGSSPPPDPPTLQTTVQLRQSAPAHRIRDTTATKIRYSNIWSPRAKALQTSSISSDPRGSEFALATTLVAQNNTKNNWSYNAGGPITGGSAIFGDSFTEASCADRLFVPVNVAGRNNLYAFDNLYGAVPGRGGSCEHGGNDNGRCTSAYCPHRIWSVTLNGALDRNSVAVSNDGSHIYVETAAGTLYALDAATGATVWTLNTTRDSDDIVAGASNVRFEGSVPWVDYTTCSTLTPVGCTLYVAVWYKIGRTDYSRVYRVIDEGSSRKSLAVGDVSTLVGEGVRAPLVLWENQLYVPTSSARLHKIDAASDLRLTQDGIWPLQLWSTNSLNPLGGRTYPPIVASPAIDGTNELLFVTVNNLLWSVNLSNGTSKFVPIDFRGHNNAASATNVPCYATPWVDSPNQTLIIGHGGASSTSYAGLYVSTSRYRAVFNRNYDTNGTLGISPGSAGVLGNNGDLASPRSSPLLLNVNGNDYVYVGDSSGALARFNYSPATGLGNLATFQTNGPIETPLVIDLLPGNLYFGTTSGTIYQTDQATLNY